MASDLIMVKISLGFYLNRFGTRLCISLKECKLQYKVIKYGCLWV